MLWEIVRQDKVLTASIIIIGIIWFVVFMRNIKILKKSSCEFQKTYEHILKAEEFKVKAKHEQ